MSQTYQNIYDQKLSEVNMNTKPVETMEEDHRIFVPTNHRLYTATHYAVVGKSHLHKLYEKNKKKIMLVSEIIHKWTGP